MHYATGGTAAAYVQHSGDSLRYDGEGGICEGGLSVNTGSHLRGKDYHYLLTWRHGQSDPPGTTDTAQEGEGRGDQQTLDDF